MLLCRRAVSTLAALLVVVALRSLSVAQCDTVGDYDAPDHELVGAGFGGTVAMSADGTIALVGGSGFDLGDGIVRSFERVGDMWVEHTAFRLFGGFGWSVAMNDGGTVAAIGAPFEFNLPDLVPGAGGVSLWDRDDESDEWVYRESIYDPDPGMNYGFGSSVAMTPDGSAMVIGRAAVSGTETDPLPDAAYVVLREGDAWSSPIALVPSPLPPARDQFGQHVAINDEGDTIAVGAPQNNFGMGLSGEIYIFRDVLGSWTHTETLTYSNPSESFHGFGTGFAFAGSELLATDPAIGNFQFDPSLSPALLVFDGSDGLFGPLPDDEISVPREYRPGHAAETLGAIISVRGSTAFVGAPGCDTASGIVDAGAVFVAERGEEGWEFVSRLQANDPQSFSSYGAGVALADGAQEMIIGEPGYGTPTHFGIGRVHLGAQVFSQQPFEVQSAVSSLSLELSFPGVSTQFFQFLISGYFDFLLPLLCSEGDPVGQFQLTGATLTTDDTVEIFPAFKEMVTISGISLTLSEPQPVSLVGFNNTAILENVEFILAGDIEFFGVPMYHAEEPVIFPQLPIQIVNAPGEPLAMAIPDFVVAPQIDVGPAVEQPSISAVIAVAGTAVAPPCNAADLAAPFGTLDLEDIVAFVTAFLAGDDAADLDAPSGLFDLADIVMFVTSFTAGCP